MLYVGKAKGKVGSTWLEYTHRRTFLFPNGASPSSSYSHHSPIPPLIYPNKPCNIQIAEFQFTEMSYPHYSTGHTANPSAPLVPEPQPSVAYPYRYPPSSQQPNFNYGQVHQGQGQNPTAASSYGGSYGYQPTPSFPPGTHPEVIRSFQMVDMDRSGFIDEKELQQALSSGYQKFRLRTIRLLMFLFKNPSDALRIGPKEFAELWSCLGQWRAVFERFDRDRSGKIDAAELRDALYSLGFAVPPTVLQVLISKYDDHSGRRPDLSFDSFVECGMIVRGLTEKFKEKDTRYTGSATLSYETFMTMVIPFLVAD